MTHQINITEGSHKEIEWAESIKDEAISYLERKIEKMEKKENDRVELYRQKLNYLLNHPRRHTANYWIRNRDYFTGLTIMEPNA